MSKILNPFRNFYSMFRILIAFRFLVEAINYGKMSRKRIGTVGESICIQVCKFQDRIPITFSHFHANFYWIYEERVEFYRENTEIVKIDDTWTFLVQLSSLPLIDPKIYTHDLRRAIRVWIYSWNWRIILKNEDATWLLRIKRKELMKV